MSVWKNWRNPIAMFAVSGMLIAAAISVLIAAGDTSDAADAGAQIGALSQAAAGIETAWFEAMGADALAATGAAPDEAQGFYDGGINRYNANRAVLAAAGIAQIDQALAASDQGLAVMNAAFPVTMQIAASGDVALATKSHLEGVVALYGNVDPAVKGLALVAQAADAKLESKLNSGASKLRLLSGVSMAIAALGGIFAGWTAWTIYRKEDDEAAAVSSEQASSWERAA